MDRIWENLDAAATPTAAVSAANQTVSAASNSSVATPQNSSELTSDDMNDVIKVLTDLDEYAEAVRNDKVGELTSVQDVSKVVDKATLANEKFVRLNAHQAELENRFEALHRRINKLRCLRMGAHITDELTAIREYSDSVAPLPQQLPPPPPTFSSSPKINPFNLGIRPHLNMPDGVMLPSVPAMPTTPPPPIALPTTPDIKIKEEIDEQKTSTRPPLPLSVPVKKVPRCPAPSIEDKSRCDEVLGQLESNLRHLVETHDSEATESSSGGESCDEFDNFSARSERTAPIKKRAKWAWLSRRASIASKWTWLTAQISDLEYRIRQQTDFYRQIRAAKGAVALGEPTVSWPAHAKKAVQGATPTEVPLSCRPPTRDYSRVDSTGRKIIIKEPASPVLSSVPPEDDDTFSACRTRPIKTLRRRRIIATMSLHRTSARAAKESTVRCDCIRPNIWCAICFGRTNHIQAPDPVSQDKSRTVALLDHSYHQVLSSKNDIPLELHIMQKIKNRSWLASASTSQANKDKAASQEVGKKRKKLKKSSSKDDDEAGLKSKKRLKRRESEGGQRSKKHKSFKGDKLRRKSVTVHHHADGSSIAMTDLSGGASDYDNMDGSPLPSPSMSHPSMSLAEQIRRKRETAFDIDNIVIPYSIAASTRVEKLKYKEILTPTWRLIDEDPFDWPKPVSTPKPTPIKPKANFNKDSKDKEKEKESMVTTVTAAMAEVAASAATTIDDLRNMEDISDLNYEVRHSKAEVEEQKRWTKPLKALTSASSSSSSNTANRSRSRRQGSHAEASSGCNTPDPLSPGTVERVDTLEVTTRPSTPVNDESPTLMSTPTSNNAASIRNRRRTSSATKSRDRNPSEDTQSSRCTTPSGVEQLQQQQQSQHEYVAPFEARQFPLSEEDYNFMLEDMPSGHECPPPLSAVLEDGNEADAESVPDHTSPARRASSRGSSVFDDEGTEEDPDWSGDIEDPDDPEWTGLENAQATPSGSAASSTVNNKSQPKKPPVATATSTVAAAASAAPAALAASANGVVKAISKN